MKAHEEPLPLLLELSGVDPPLGNDRRKLRLLQPRLEGRWHRIHMAHGVGHMTGVRMACAWRRCMHLCMRGCVRARVRACTGA